MSKLKNRLALAMIIGAASIATASLAAGADAVKTRIDNMKAMGGAVKLLGDQLRSGAPDPAIVQAQAAKIAAASKAMPSWFPAGSGAEAGVKTRALPGIWSNPTGFNTALGGLAAQAAKLNAAAARGDMAATGGELRALYPTCKTCHDEFRGPET